MTRHASLAVLAILAVGATGCVSPRASRHHSSWDDRPTWRSEPARSTSRLSAEPRDGSWPSVRRTSEPAPRAPLPVGLLTREGALRTIREAKDGESAIRALEARRFAFPLDDESLAYFADNGIPIEVMDYLTKRARVDWDELRPSSNADRASDQPRSAARSYYDEDEDDDAPSPGYVPPYYGATTPPATTTPSTTVVIQRYRDPWRYDDWYWRTGSSWSYRRSSGVTIYGGSSCRPTPPPVVVYTTPSTRHHHRQTVVTAPSPRVRAPSQPAPPRVVSPSRGGRPVYRGVAR